MQVIKEHQYYFLLGFGGAKTREREREKKRCYCGRKKEIETIECQILHIWALNSHLLSL
jgi:hypothetical protein